LREASTDALRDCYNDIKQWGTSVRSWLTENLVSAALAGELPNPPTFEYARAMGTSLDLTRRTRDAFVLAKQNIADPTALLKVAISFHDPAPRPRCSPRCHRWPACSRSPSPACSIRAAPTSPGR